MQNLVKQDRIDMLVNIGRQWALLFLFSELIFFSFMASGFLTLNAFQIIFFFGTAVLLMATAELFVIITGGIDLSVGYVMGLATIISAKLIASFSGSGMSALPAIFLGIIITLIIGLIPGLIMAFLFHV